MNKKADIGATITWIAAMLIIFFLSIIFLVATVTLSAKKFLSFEENEILIQDNFIKADLSIQKTLESFLAQKLNFNNQELTIMQLIINYPNNEEAKKTFSENAHKTFSQFFPSSVYGSKTPPWKITVQSAGNKNADFQAESYFCNYEDKKNALAFSNFIEDKKITLCISRLYYARWKSAKYE